MDMEQLSLLEKPRPKERESFTNTIPDPIPDDWQVGDSVEILETGDRGRIDWVLCISRKFCAVDYGRGYGYFNSNQIRKTD